MLFRSFRSGWGFLPSIASLAIPAEQIYALLSMMPCLMLKFIIDMMAIRGRAPAMPEKLLKNAVRVYTIKPPISRGRIGSMPECLHTFYSVQYSYSARQSSLEVHFCVTRGYEAVATAHSAARNSMYVLFNIRLQII